jgi:hypothetical protein
MTIPATSNLKKS